MKRIMLLLSVSIAAYFFAGISGILFELWPTSWPDQNLAVTTESLEALQKLRAKSKFHRDLERGYPGAASEVIRSELELKTNLTLDTLIQEVSSNPKKSYVLAIFKITLKNAERYDSEDRDQLLRYLTEALYILKNRSSNQLFGVWRYGFPF